MSEDFTLLLNQILAIDWDVLMGLLAAPVFIGGSVYLLVTTRWPWPGTERYRGLILSGIFLILGCWSAAGLSGITKGFGSLLASLISLAFIGGFLFLLWRWALCIPLVGERYILGSLGEVEVVSVDAVQGGATRVVYKETKSGMQSSAPIFVFTIKARPLAKDRPLG